MNRYILLLRHGAVNRSSNILAREQSLAGEGKEDTTQIARALAEVLNELPDEGQIRIGQVWRGTYSHVTQTAAIMMDALEQHIDSDGQRLSDGETLLKEDFDPSNFGPYENKGVQVSCARELKAQLDAWEDSGDGSNAILVAGNQPLLGWIGFELLKESMPIGRSEVVCLSSRSSNDKWSLLWSLAPKDDETAKLLREKIKSKMDIAKLLGAFVIAIFGLIFGVLLGGNTLEDLESSQQVFLYISAALFLFSIGMYFASMYAYDGLLMPTRFWASKPPKAKRPGWLVWRPPSSSTRVLYQNMVRIWNYLFTPATISVVLVG